MFEFCLPTGAKVAPDGADWLHEMTGTASGWRGTAIACV